MPHTKELTRDQLISRLVEIYKWERTYGDLDEFQAEVAALNALLASTK